MEHEEIYITTDSQALTPVLRNRNDGRIVGYGSGFLELEELSKTLTFPHQWELTLVTEVRDVTPSRVMSFIEIDYTTTLN